MGRFNCLYFIFNAPEIAGKEIVDDYDQEGKNRVCDSGEDCDTEGQKYQNNASGEEKWRGIGRIKELRRKAKHNKNNECIEQPEHEPQNEVNNERQLYDRPDGDTPEAQFRRDCGHNRRIARHRGTRKNFLEIGRAGVCGNLHRGVRLLKASADCRITVTAKIDDSGGDKESEDGMRRFLMFAIPIALFAAAGFGYYALVGCNSGTCPLTSSPVTTTAYGGLIGALIALNLRKGQK